MANKVIATSYTDLIAKIANTSTTKTSYISIEVPTSSDIITVLNSIDLPATLANNSNQLIIDGNGITLQAPATAGLAGQYIISRKHPGLDNTACSFVFKNITFDGMARTTSGIELCNASDVIFDNCRFINVANGTVLRNVKNASFVNCIVQSVAGNAYMTTYGDWIGSTPENSYCSNILFDHCKVDNLALPTGANSAYGWYIVGATGVEINDCLSTNNVFRHIVFDSLGSTYNPAIANNFNVNNFNFGSWTEEAINLKLTDGYVKLNGLHTTQGGVVIRAMSYASPGAANPHLYIENIPYLDPSAQFHCIGGIITPVGCPVTEPSNVVVWSFKEVYTNGTDIFGASRWVDSIIPYHRYAEYFDESKTIKTNYMKVNTNIIS
jgi:hypothetical protein